MYKIIKADKTVLPKLADFSARFFDEKWSEGSFSSELEKANSAVFCALCDGEIIAVACAENQFGDGYLHNIAVDDRFRRQGIAQKIIEYAVDFLKFQGVNKLFLEVRVSNIAAVSLYEKLGFSKITVRKGFYSNPIEDAYSMVMEIYDEDISNRKLM